MFGHQEKYSNKSFSTKKLTVLKSVSAWLFVKNATIINSCIEQGAEQVYIESLF